MHITVKSAPYRKRIGVSINFLQYEAYLAPDGCPKIVNLGSSKTDLFYERKKYGFKKRQFSEIMDDKSYQGVIHIEQMHSNSTLIAD